MQTNFIMTSETLPYENLHYDFQKAIIKRLKRSGLNNFIPAVSNINDVETLDILLESLLEGKSPSIIKALLNL